MSFRRRVQERFGPNGEDKGIIVDERVLEHLSTDSDPNQAALDELLARVDRIRVIKGGVSNGQPLGGEVLLDVRGARHVRALAAALRIIEDPDVFGRYNSLCDHAIELFAGSRRLATLGLHQSFAIRWDAWGWDAILMEDEPLLDWLSARGVHGPRECWNASHEAARRMMDPLYRWITAMPQSLRPFWPDRHHGDGDGDPELAAALAEELPDPSRRAAVLLEWFGSGAGPWSGYPSHENIPEQLLLELPLDILIQAASEAQGRALGGAARLFAGVAMKRRHPGASAALPEQTRRAMLEYVLPYAEEDTRKRALAAFGEPS